MELNSSTNRQDVENLARNLFSRDPILFDAVLNSHFASHARYTGHALSISGVSAIKHAAFTLNYLDLGRGADIRSKDVSWSHKETRATIKSTRHLRPLFFPLFTFAVPVETVIQFHPDGSSRGSSLLYATYWEDRWPASTFLTSLPIIGFLISSIFTPLASLLVVAVCNAFFHLHTHLASHLRRRVEPAAHGYAKRAHQALPAGARDAASDGFQRGSTAATGYAESALRLGKRISYGPLVAIEGVTQTFISVAIQPFLPFAAPRISVFDSANTRRSFQSAAAAPRGGAPALDEPIPLRAQASLSSQDSHAKRSDFDEETNPRGPGGNDQVGSSTTSSVMPPAIGKSSTTTGAAKVQVGDGPAFSIPAHQDNEDLLKQQQKRPVEAADNARGAAAQGAKEGGSLFDKATADTKAMNKAKQAAAPSAGGGGGGKKGKKGNNRDKGGASGGQAGEVASTAAAGSGSHAAPPKFTDGLDAGQVKEGGDNVEK